MKFHINRLLEEEKFSWEQVWFSIITCEHRKYCVLYITNNLKTLMEFHWYCKL